jgi:hypothetical protein
MQKIGAVALAVFSGLAVGVSAAQAAQWNCTKTDDGTQNPGGACGPYLYRPISDSDGYNTSVLNDMWNPPGVGHQQTVYANSPGDWQVTANEAKGNTAVLSYPDVQQILTTTSNTPTPVSGFAGILGDFTEAMPANGDNEAAYDIWMGRSASTNYAQEVMIWVDNHRTNPAPGKIVGKPTFHGARYTVWQDPSAGGAGFHTIYMVRDGRQTSGTVNILAMLEWLVQRKLTAATGLNQVDFGWEICSTDGKAETFRMSRYALSLQCRAGGKACYSS